MWTKFNVEMKFLTQLCGSLPADPELQKKWLEARKPRVRPPDSKSIDEVAQEVLESTKTVEEPDVGFYVFQRQEGGLALRMATIRAHIKDCARVLSSLYVGKIEKEKSFAVKVVNAVYYDPAIYWLPVLNQTDGSPITQPTGIRDKAIHVRTPQGERSAIKTFEYVENAMLRFPLLLLTQPSGKTVISKTDLKHILNYGGVHGYGGERSDGEGRYIATIDNDGVQIDD